MTISTTELDEKLDALYHPERKLSFEEGLEATERQIELFQQWQQWLEEKYATGLPSSMLTEIFEFAKHGTRDRQLIEANYAYIAEFTQRAILASQSASSSKI